MTAYLCYTATPKSTQRYAKRVAQHQILKHIGHLPTGDILDHLYLADARWKYKVNHSVAHLFIGCHVSQNFLKIEPSGERRNGAIGADQRVDARSVVGG